MRIVLPLLLACLWLPFAQAQAQTIDIGTMNSSYPQEYEIGGITVSGTVSTDPNAVKLFSGLAVGDKLTIPGDRISVAIRNLWAQKLFSDVRVEAAEVRGRTIFLHIAVLEKPRLSRFKFIGVSKSEADKLREEVALVRGQQVNEALVANTRYSIQQYFSNKGFLKANAEILELNTDSLMSNSVQLTIDVKKGPRVKIKDVVFNGNEELSDKRLRKAMKKTKQKRWYNVFGSSKFLREEFKSDKDRVLDLYNEKGHRNAAILRDTVYFVSDSRIRVEMDIDEGQRFYFRNITFTGNTKHNDEELRAILNIETGDVYNKKVLESRLYMNPTGRDISSLYMDDGYLSFYPDPVEILAEGDSIDIDVRIREGKQYRIRSVIINGNSKTNEHVVRREIRTRPGELFNRSDVIRTQRELSNLGYFNPETLGVNPIQDVRTRLGRWSFGDVLGTIVHQLLHAQHVQQERMDSTSKWRWADPEPACADQRPLLPELQHELCGALAGRSQAQCPQHIGVPLGADQRRIALPQRGW